MSEKTEGFQTRTEMLLGLTVDANLDLRAENSALKEQNARLKALLRESRECVNNDMSGENRFGLLQRIDAEIKTGKPSSEPSPASDDGSAADRSLPPFRGINPLPSEAVATEAPSSV